MAKTENIEETEQLQPERQKLYMIEFIVDDINLDFCNMRQLACQPEGQTVIKFKFFDMGPFRMCENDYSKKKNYIEGCKGTGRFKNGKSCLFGLTPTKAEAIKEKLLIICDVYKEVTAEYSYHYGTAFIPCMNMFRELVDSVTAGGQNYYFKHTKDCYKIKNLDTGDLVGHLVAYVRVSCFKEIIINKFKMDKTHEVDYKTEQGVHSFKYNKQEKGTGEATGDKLGPCECPLPQTGVNRSQGACNCPSQYPALNCPQTFATDPACRRACPFDCASGMGPRNNCMQKPNLNC